MKKFTAIVLALVTVLVCFAACSGKTNGPAYASAVEVFTKVFDSYAEDQKFPIGGGDEANMSMEAPAKYDHTLTEELNNVAALPASQAENITDAATGMNMMMANNFTAAAYLLKDGTDAQAFADAYKSELDVRRWMCGCPEKFVVIASGNCVVTAFGLANTIDYFKTQATTVLEGATVLAEGDIVA